MKFSYIDYAMSVIVSRALPDVRDGLKPVHRRILYAMQEAGMTSGKPYKKSARIVGEVLGKYHPHGDSSVYDAIVRMAQDFSMRYQLADGHGNFGSVDGDPAAAMRYTEVRMSKISELMLQDNIGEIIDATLYLIDDPDASTADLMKIVKGPDFPTAALIIGKEGIRDAYRTGRGSIKMRARTRIEQRPNGRSRIVVTELPYQVNKARLIEKIADLVRDKTIEGITDLRDESDRQGMRIVIDLRRDITAQIVLNQLFKHTQMQDTFGVNMIALVNGSPQILTLKEILAHYIKHQEEVITRRTKFDLAKAKARAHILQGLTTAVKNLDNVIKIVRESSSIVNAKMALVNRLNFSDAQAQAILDLRLQKLTSLERDKLDEEYQSLLADIKKFQEILGDEQKILQIIKDELKAVKGKFNDRRRTEIIGEELAAFEAEDLINDDDIVVTLTHGGYVKRIDLSTYKKQKRGGVGVTGMGTKEEDFVEQILITTTHHTILFFTNKGKVFHLKAYQIAESGRAAKGVHISNLLMIEPGEKITALIKVRDFDPTRYLFMATKKGIVKKTQLSEFSSMMKRGLLAIKLDGDDELIGVKFTEGERYIILGTAQGMTISFAEEEVRSMGRNARGVRGITLKRGDRVVGMDKLRKGAEVLSVSEEGIGKRTPTEEYRPQGRGGKGLINMKVTEKTGEVVGIKVVTPDQELLLITTEGIVIRTSIDDIGLRGRNTQGVILMKTKDDDKVASLATVTLKND